MYLRQNFGLQRGFEVFRIPRPVPILPDESWYLLRRGMQRAMSIIDDTSQLDRLYGRGEDIGHQVRYLLTHRDTTRPFFMFANYMDAHFPYIPPAPFDRKFPGKQRGLFRQDIERVQEKVVQGQEMPERFRSHTLSQYDGGIAYLDAEIGRVVEWLKSSNTYDDTLIVVCSDHGEAFGEKHLVMHGNSAYQNLLHVPLLIKFPKSTQKGVVDDPVSLIDVMPTILGVLGQSVPSNVQGSNLLEASSLLGRELFAEAFPCPAPHTADCPSGCMARAAFSWPYKGMRSSNGQFELYDIANDPGENRNLAASQASRAIELDRGLARWVKTMPYRANQVDKLNADTLQRLKSLGYIQ
jgi:arylsulfatase A-like enzyme